MVLAGDLVPAGNTLVTPGLGNYFWYAEVCSGVWKRGHPKSEITKI